MVQKIQKTIEIPQAQDIDKVVDAPVVQVVQVPQVQVVEKTIEVPQLRNIEKFVEIPEIQTVQGTRTSESLDSDPVRQVSPAGCVEVVDMIAESRGRACRLGSISTS